MPSNNSHITLRPHSNPYSTPGTNTRLNKTNWSSESSRSILSLNSSLIPHLCCWQQAFHESYCTQLLKMLIWFHFALVSTNDTHLSFENPPNKWLKTPQKKGNTRKVFGEKLPSNMTIIETSFDYQHRKFRKLSHSPASSHCVATVAFCLHVSNQRLRHWSKQLPIGDWRIERAKQKLPSPSQKEHFEKNLAVTVRCILDNIQYNQSQS